MQTTSIPANCFAAMFDIVGFKALRADKGTAGLHRLFRSAILPSIEHSAAGKGKFETIDGVKKYCPDFTGTTVRYRAISDSVIYFTPDDSFGSFVSIIQSAYMLLQFGFYGGKAPYRGAIGWGDLIDDSAGILIGSAIEDAYEGESRQAWAGAMLTEVCRDIVNQRGFVERISHDCNQAAESLHDSRDKQNALDVGRRLVRYPVPIQANPKDGPVTYGTLDTYALNWTINMYEGASQKAFATSTNPHAITINQNTQAFEKWARKQGNLSSV